MSLNVIKFGAQGTVKDLHPAPSFPPLVWGLLPGADFLGVGGGPCVTLSNWPPSTIPRHSCELLTLQDGACPGANRACLLLWSLQPSKDDYGSACCVGVGDTIIGSLTAGTHVFLHSREVLAGSSKCISCLEFGPLRISFLSICVSLSVWPLFKWDLERHFSRRSPICCWL